MLYQFKCPAHGEFEVEQSMMVYHEAICPICNGPALRVYTPLVYYWPDVLFDKQGRKQSPDGLPHVPSGTRYTHGWTPKENNNA